MRASGSTTRLLLALAPLVLAIACAEPPTKEMNQAQGAIDAARAAGAADYATDEFRAAEAALTRSRQAVDERDYRQALNYALDARDRAQSAARTGADEKARARTEADRALRAAEATLEQTRERLQAAEAASVTAAALKEPRRTVDESDAALHAARAAFDKGAYRQAVGALTDVQTRLVHASSEIDAAIAARPARRATKRGR